MRSTLHPHQKAILDSVQRRPDKRITLDQINLLPVFDKLSDIKKAAQSAKTALIKQGVIRMARRGVYELNN